MRLCWTGYLETSSPTEFVAHRIPPIANAKSRATVAVALARLQVEATWLFHLDVDDRTRANAVHLVEVGVGVRCGWRKWCVDQCGEVFAVRLIPMMIFVLRKHFLY